MNRYKSLSGVVIGCVMLVAVSSTSFAQLNTYEGGMKAENQTVTGVAAEVYCQADSRCDFNDKTVPYEHNGSANDSVKMQVRLGSTSGNFYIATGKMTYRSYPSRVFERFVEYNLPGGSDYMTFGIVPDKANEMFHLQHRTQSACQGGDYKPEGCPAPCVDASYRLAYPDPNM